MTALQLKGFTARRQELNIMMPEKELSKVIMPTLNSTCKTSCRPKK